MGSPEQLTGLHREVQRVREEAARQIRRADRRAHAWVTIDIALGLPAALLAAVSGAAGLAAEHARVPAAILALISAGLSAGAGFLRSDHRRIANKKSRKAWAAVDSEALLVLMRMDDLDPAALDRALRSLFDKRLAAMGAYEDDIAERSSR